jgi:tetratricopeptide (TPR) repeat protein
MTGRLVRQILIKGSTAGLSVAGAAILGPAWPIVFAALQPVLDVLTEKLDGADPAGSPETAARAADAFEQDPRLAELLRTNLEKALAGQERIDASLQAVCRMIMDNSEELEQINRAVGSIDERLEAGVALAPEAEERLVDATARRIAAMLEARGFASEQLEAVEATEEEPAGWLSRDEVVDEANRSEVEAVQQIQAGHPEEALRTLRAARARVAMALAETPSDIHVRLTLGYLLKATAQASNALGDDAAAAEHLREAERIFRLARTDLPADPETQTQIASALNGLGNIFAERGQPTEAVPMYREAVRLVPSYGYAWHDLLLSLVVLAEHGDVRPGELDDAWNGLVAAAPSYPGLEPEALQELRARYERCRTATAT